ncbi:MAG: hypothetical protein R2708_15670 [Vicinamibacterales bacterium]
MPTARASATATVAALLLLLTPPVVAAQPGEALGGWAIDLRAAVGALPTAAGWTPALETGGGVPGRGFGAEAGVHLLAGPGRHKRLSLGASGFGVQGRTSNAESSVTVTTRMLAAAPHLAVNFGHRQGWSYVSAGAGAATVTSTIDGEPDDGAGWGLVVHYGAGARWFVREHLAVSMDLRFWALTPRGASTSRPNAGATTRVLFSAGVAVR